MYLISSCLIGTNCRYDGKNCGKVGQSSIIQSLHKEGLVVAVCPECDGGLPTPRKPSEIEPGCDGFDVIKKKAKVVNIEECDVTDNFVKGAKIALQKAKDNGIKVAILKDFSPSCGSVKIYDGSFKGKKIEGVGVTTALLRDNGIKVFSEEQVSDAVEFLKKQKEQEK